MKFFLKFRKLIISRQHINKISLIGLLVLLISSTPIFGEIPAFPRAEGYGAKNIGGSAPLQRGNAQVNAIHNFSKQGPYSNSYSYEITSSGDAIPACPVLYVYGNIRSTQLKQTYPKCVGNSHLDELLSETCQAAYTMAYIKYTCHHYGNEFYYSEDIMLNMGALRPFRDAVDERVIAEYLSRTGQIIDNVVFPDDFPTFKTLAPPTDSDNDGMPDKLETANNLNPAVPDNNTLMSSGFTAIEVYINELADPPIILSTDDFIDNHNKSISPNPTSNIFTISLKVDALIKAFVYSEIGKQIKEVTSNEITLINLPDAIYFVKIITQSGNTVVEKVVKM